ncbi:erythromycin biosynthesis sensory transduction protein eryC1 [Comamonas serinivorans]|uniref:Erythromycin biosynthesis sensory transduction protein eryC1 n=1 Tax=Comamonas serinivorans TaxID=1082851 RepID=A0A1Y0EJQ0_9BURK|nr:DegT/DnrJ/EryC1/StrS family aminotransferase [Comamonas serinivorans]ARU03651.1 erythromycin biosynthesis sensory transduction protein eryC1 [Comamonas serinivorans]
MQINDLQAHVRAKHAAIATAVQRVIASGWLILGPEVRAFEAAFAGYVGVAHAVGVANGTDAIELALRALGVQAGDTVATAANASLYAATAMAPLGAQPLFLDVDPASHTVPLAEVERAVAEGARAVVITHLYGRAAPDIEAIARLCAAQGVRLLEDCAQAHGARLHGRCVGSFGDAASFSFYPTKNLGALGDGGAVVTPHADVAEAVTRLRQYGWTSKYTVSLAGARNSRLDELQAAVLSALLPGLDADNARRRDVARRYGAGITHPAVTAPGGHGEDDVAHLYVVRCQHAEARDSLREHLRQQGIASDVHYPVPDHRQPVFGTRFAALQLPHTERLCTQVLTLPCYPEMTADQVQAVIDAVNAWPQPH